jgi:nitrite reductase [NAD(P)H] small subunit
MEATLAARWVRVCKPEDIPVMGARVIRRETGDIAIFRNAVEEYFALLDRCPHKGGPLSQGIVFGESVACPLHNWTISLVDGQAKAPDVGCAVSFACKVEGDTVYLDADELAHKALDVTVPLAGPRAKTGD